METNLEPPNKPPSPPITTATTITPDFLSPPSLYGDDFYLDDSTSSTPYVSAPSSPGRSSYLPSPGFFYSAPASPMHFVLATAPARSSAAGGLIPTSSDASSSTTASFEFEFSARFDSPAPDNGVAMSSADELFHNGQIRPMKLCAHLQRPQKLPPLTLLESERENEDEDDDDDEVSDDVFMRSSRDLRLRKNRSQRRRTRSLSPLRSTTPFDWFSNENDNDNLAKKKERENNNEESVKEKEGEGEGEGETEGETTPSGSSSRCSSAGRSSKRWIFLKDFLRSKSEGRSNNKFWHNINISFSPVKERREKASETASFIEERKSRKKESGGATAAKKAAAGKRRSAHELHYAANRAQAEEMRKKTFLPYRQGLLGCLGFNSKSYGALNGFARALNPVSSR